MSTVEFGIIPDIARYTPYDCAMRIGFWEWIKRFHCIYLDDDLVLPWFNDHFGDIPVCWDTPDRPGVGVDYCGITLIPPDSARLMIERLTARAARVDEAERGELLRLIALLQRAVDEDRWAICFGV